MESDPQVVAKAGNQGQGSSSMPTNWSDSGVHGGDPSSQSNRGDAKGPTGRGLAADTNLQVSGELDLQTYMARDAAMLLESNEPPDLSRACNDEALTNS